MRKVTRSEKETYDFATSWAKKLKGGEVLALSGDLGAGKTAFAKGIAAGLGITKTVTSPTFVLMKVYPIKNGLVKFFVHVDAYRLKNAKSLEAIGLLDYIGSSEAVVLIEWAERVKKILPKNVLAISIIHKNFEERIINTALTKRRKKRKVIINN